MSKAKAEKVEDVLDMSIKTIDDLLSINDFEQFKQVVQQQGPSMPVGFYGEIIDNLSKNDPRRDFVMDLMVQKYI